MRMGRLRFSRQRAIAETVEDARRLLRELDTHGDIPAADLAKEPSVRELTEPVAFMFWGSA